ncbi:GNAT family N-acetyltransferase [Hoeflea sp. TYP-13]|uniref:GNAT family N-acetyltransferase n=1 Tax=Hoeflea sp. TYP-13 TaxID=3230023 RepID=UPI0034C5D09E
MIEIRQALAKESRQLAHIGILAWEDAVRNWDGDASKVRENAHAAYHDFTTKCWDRIVTALMQGTIVGWGAREALDFRISDLWINPEHYRKGVGTVLLKSLEEGAVQAGFDHTELETLARNTNAIEFYKRFGYRVTSLSVKYSPSLQQDIEKVTMRKELSGIVEA